MRELRFSALFNKDEKYIEPGEFYASSADIVISTLLGSCISVALYDASLHLGGLNHFMLPFKKLSGYGEEETKAKYGIHAMELLINDIMRRGGRKKNLRAKVFGGSSILAFQGKAAYDIPKMNIRFAFEFLETEKIPVDSYSVGGLKGRRIYFFPDDARVMMKYSDFSAGSLIWQETQYAHRLMEETENSGKPVLF